ncbi:MAG: YIP1 family protein [Pyrinomonadaceae bacterium]
MNRLVGIVVAAIGLLVAVLSILKIVPGLTAPGVMMIVLGGIIIGLSFINAPETDAAERMSTPNTLINSFFSPTELFQNLRRHPRWLVAALIMAVLSATYSNLFMYRLTPERVANYAIDKTLEMSFLNDDARKQIESSRAATIEESKNPVARAGQAVSSFGWQVIGYSILAGIFLLFGLAMGGNINFWQAFSVAVYALFPVAVIRFILNTVVLFIKDPIDIHPITGQSSLIQDNLNFLVTPADNPVIYVFLGSLSILWFYWVWLNATGLKNAGERISGSTAWTASLVIYGALVLLGAVSAFLFPSFIS